MSVAVVVAVSAVVPVVAVAVGKPIINMAATTATVVNGGNHIGRWSDCTGQRPGSLLRTYDRCQTPSEWAWSGAQDGNASTTTVQGRTSLASTSAVGLQHWSTKFA